MKVGQDSTRSHSAPDGRHVHSSLLLISLSLDEWGSKSSSGHADQPVQASLYADLSGDSSRMPHSPSKRLAASTSHVTASASSSLIKSSSTSSAILITTLLVWALLAIILLAGPWELWNGPTKSPRGSPRETSHPVGTSHLPSTQIGTRISVEAADNVQRDQRQEAIALLLKCGILSKDELDSGGVSQEHLSECLRIAEQMLRLRPMDEWVTLSQYGQQSFQETVAAIFEADERARTFVESQGDARAQALAADTPSPRAETDVPTRPPSMPPSMPPSAPPSAPMSAPPSAPPSAPMSATSLHKGDFADSSISLGSVASFGRSEAWKHSTGRSGSPDLRDMVGSSYEVPGRQSNFRSNPASNPLPFKSPVPILNCYDHAGAEQTSVSSYSPGGSSTQLEVSPIMQMKYPDDRSPVVSGPDLSPLVSQPDLSPVISEACVSEGVDAPGVFQSVFASSSAGPQLSQRVPQGVRNAPTPETPQFVVSPQASQKASPSPTPTPPTPSPGKLLRLKSQEIMTAPPGGWSSLPVPGSQSGMGSTVRLQAREIMAPASKTLSK